MIIGRSNEKVCQVNFDLIVLFFKLGLQPLLNPLKVITADLEVIVNQTDTFAMANV